MPNSCLTFENAKSFGSRSWAESIADRIVVGVLEEAVDRFDVGFHVFGGRPQVGLLVGRIVVVRMVGLGDETFLAVAERERCF